MNLKKLVVFIRFRNEFIKCEIRLYEVSGMFYLGNLYWLRMYLWGVGLYGIIRVGVYYVIFRVIILVWFLLKKGVVSDFLYL